VQHALGIGRRSRCVEQQADIVRGAAANIRGCTGLREILEANEPVRQCAVAPHDRDRRQRPEPRPDLLHHCAIVEAPEQLRDQDDLRPGLGDDEGDLEPAIDRYHRIDDRAQPQRRLDRDHSLPPVGQDDRDHVAAPDAQRVEPRRAARHPVGERTVGQARRALYQRQPVAIRLGGSGQMGIESRVRIVP